VRPVETTGDLLRIEEVARRLGLKPLGSNGWFNGPCPWEGLEDKDESFYLYPPGHFHCYGCGRSGDVADLQGALAAEDRVELPQEHNGRHSSFLKFRTAREVAEATPEEVPWSARPWLARGAILEIDGPIKRAGKTSLVSHMAACILDGKPFMGEPTARTKVVFLTEQSPTSFRKVLERAGLTDREDLLILHWHDTIGMEWHDVAHAAADKAREFGAGVLVVDTIGQFAGIKGDGENSAGEAQEAMKPLQEAASNGLAIVVTRHDRKAGGEVGESGRGSTAWGGIADVIMAVRRHHMSDARPTVRVIESLSRFEETPDKLIVELTEQGYRSLGDAVVFADQEAMKAIVELLPSKPENSTATADLLDALQKRDVRRTVANEALKKLTTAGTVLRIGEGKKGDPYCYYKPSPDQGDEPEILSSTLKDEAAEERKLEPDNGDATLRDEPQILSSETQTYIA
jgi:predicted transcriptional regulator